MDWLLKNAALMGLIVSTARGAQVPPELVLGIIEAESGGGESENPAWTEERRGSPRDEDQCDVPLHDDAGKAPGRVLRGYGADVPEDGLGPDAGDRRDGARAGL